eukprot:6468315-Amphidinium_carterae.1
MARCGDHPRARRNSRGGGTASKKWHPGHFRTLVQDHTCGYQWRPSQSSQLCSGPRQAAIRQHQAHPRRTRVIGSTLGNELLSL